MALPWRRQRLAKFISARELTHAQVAEAIGVTAGQLHALSKGRRYPSPNEIVALEKFFGLAIEVLLDPELLAYRNGPWPVPVGRKPQHCEHKVASESAPSEGTVRVPIEYIPSVLAFLDSVKSSDVE